MQLMGGGGREDGACEIVIQRRTERSASQLTLWFRLTAGGRVSWHSRGSVASEPPGREPGIWAAGWKSYKRLSVHICAPREEREKEKKTGCIDCC